MGYSGGGWNGEPIGGGMTSVYEQISACLGCKIWVPSLTIVFNYALLKMPYHYSDP